MGDDPKNGDKALCDMCGAEIEYIGPYWQHTGTIQPRHPAVPYRFVLTDSDAYRAMIDRHTADIDHIEAQITEAQAAGDFALRERLEDHMQILREVHQADIAAFRKGSNPEGGTTNG